MGTSRKTDNTDKKYVRNFIWNLQRKRPLDASRVDGMTILKWTLTAWGCGLDSTGWEQRPMSRQRAFIFLIIITWRYSPTWALASCAIRLHWSLSWDFLLNPSIPISRRSSWTSSSHLTLVYPFFSWCKISHSSLSWAVYCPPFFLRDRSNFQLP
jgi:hypothetical protein